ncbi:hypothetical protein LQ564_25555, partial [Massilia sp. G4R7]
MTAIQEMHISRSLKLMQSSSILLKARLTVEFLLHRGRFHPALARKASAFPSTGRHGGTHRHVSQIDC